MYLTISDINMMKLGNVLKYNYLKIMNTVSSIIKEILLR